MILSHSDTPSAVLRRFLEGGEPVAFSFESTCYYLAEKPVIRLAAVLIKTAPGGGRILVSDRVDEIAAWVGSGGLKAGDMDGLSRSVAAPWLSLEGGWRLQPVNIAKPWGREIWYTGIESRGQSLATDGRFSVPLPWLLALSPGDFLAEGLEEPSLVKILDPLDEEVYGDLYFELHQKKQEVYVVTHIAETAWPGGQGGIRYGFDPAVRQRYGDDGAFRQAYLEVVKAYEKVRRHIDACLDGFRLEAGLSLNEPVAPEVLKSWLGRLDASLRREEEAARSAMNAFTHLVPLTRGDVVKVSTLTPHALQHGVRTVEFQTPVYERKILNFAQKVLTQDHWDTEDAVAMMRLEAGAVEVLPRIVEADGYFLDRVVEFDDFTVYRLTLGPGRRFPLTPAGHYRILFTVSGEVAFGDLHLQTEEAALLPGTSTLAAVANPGSEDAIVLISIPR